MLSLLGHFESVKGNTNRSEIERNVANDKAREHDSIDPMSVPCFAEVTLVVCTCACACVHGESPCMLIMNPTMSFVL
jgi:hypothetical protein